MKSPLACCAAFVLAFAAPWIAVAGDWHLSLEPLAGLRYGELGEYVYLKNTSYSSDKLSELNWEYKPLWYAGAKVNAGWRGIEASASVTAALPGKVGTMYDSDWLNIQYTGLEDYQYKTNYTESDSYLCSAYSWGVCGGYRFKPLSFFSIKPFAAYEYTYMSFDGKGLDGWYGTTLSNPSRISAYTDTSNRKEISTSTDVTVISYKRESNIAWLGVEGTVTFPFGMDVTLGTQLSPFVYTVSIDDHYYNDSSGTGTEYADACYGWFSALKLYSSVSYAFTRHIALCLYGSYFFYFQPLRGDDYTKKLSADSYTKSSTSDGGANIWEFDTGLSVKYTFF